MPEASGPDAVWVAAVHAGATDQVPLGAAVVIDQARVLTCAHVVTTPAGEVLSPLWVALPMADDPDQRVEVHRFGSRRSGPRGTTRSTWRFWFWRCC